MSLYVNHFDDTHEKNEGGFIFSLPAKTTHIKFSLCLRTPWAIIEPHKMTVMCYTRVLPSNGKVGEWSKGTPLELDIKYGQNYQCVEITKTLKSLYLKAGQCVQMSLATEDLAQLTLDYMEDK